MSRSDQIIITGGNGFLGTEVVNNVVAQGMQVILLARRVALASSISNVRVIEVDFAKGEILVPFAETRDACFLHLAASVPGQLTGQNAEVAALENQRIDNQVIHFCEEHHIRLIYASGTSVYGLGFDKPRKERDALAPFGPYVKEKCEAEKRIMSSEALIKPCILRIGAPYGPGQRRPTVITNFITCALNNRALYYFGTGNRAQEFTYVSDIANAFVCAIRSKAHGIFNISSGRPISMRDLASMVKSLVPKSRSCIEASGTPDPQESYRGAYDISAARQQLHWEPAVGLEAGLSKYIAFLRTSC